jgi:hypothetical protein
MRKDFQIPKVEDIALVVAKEVNEINQEEWFVYLINLKNKPINNVIIASKGYGKKEGKDVKTSILRHYFELIEPRSVNKVEMIREELFGLSNEYWLSFYEEGQVYDKKYVFVAESIKEENFTQIPLMNKEGVMLK